MHILLLEPNTLLAKAYTQALQLEGHTVSHVTGAQAAVDAADERLPDVVVLELQLPEHSGLEFLHEFRSYPEWQRVPVVVHSMVSPAKTAAVAESLRRDLGVCAFLYKPRTSLQQLLRAVREAAPAPGAAASGKPAGQGAV